MMIPTDVTFQGIPVSDALRNSIIDRVERLSRQAPDALSCHVTVSLEGQRRNQGNLYRVHTRLVLPGGEINAGTSPPADASHEDPYVAVRDSFDALRRQMEDFIRRDRGDVKHHEERA